MNSEITDLSKKISNHELKRLVGIEERFLLIQDKLNAAKRLQHEQQDCAEVSFCVKRETFSNSFCCLVSCKSTTKI